MQYKIQSLVFPTDEKHGGCRKLFYRGDSGIYNQEKQILTLGFAQRCDFVTYLNACSWQKWQKYTSAKSLTLHLRIKGEARVTFLGYHREALTVTQKEFAKKDYQAAEETEIEYTFPDNDEQMVGFEIAALSPELTIFGGYFTVEVDEKEMNPVVLAIATTTCKKEDFIRRNTELIKRELLSGEDELAKNLYLHVTDNGQTLTEKDIHGEHVFLHPNINAGGSGGFARGMIESLRQEPEATHVLLMDDDVLVLPESIRRTYNLLRLMRPEYKRSFISGAMLYYERPNKQHEDVGTIGGPLKGAKINHEKLRENLANEQILAPHRNSYAAWWYCCVPVSVIKEVGLPLPLFIRMDDAEYGMRAKTDFITLNGICVWHMGFTTKHNAVFDKYQTLRNEWIGQATTGVMPDVDVLAQFKDSYRTEIMRFSYDTAELILQALEDFMKGPEFIMQPQGDKIVAERYKLNDKFSPLSKVQGGDAVQTDNIKADLPLRFENRLFLKLTWNGQRWCPKFLENPNLAAIQADWVLQPERSARRTQLLAVNPYEGTGVVYRKDRKRFKELMQRYKKLVKEFEKNRDKIYQQYQEKRDYLTSEEFWREYLGI